MSAYVQKISNSLTGLYKRYENLGYRAKKKIKFVIGRIFLYYVLIELAFLFLLPFIYIFSTALMTSNDYLDATVSYIPTSIEWSNFTKAWDAMDYPTAFMNSMGTSLLSAIAQTMMCALAGYSLGRFRYKFRNVAFFLVVLVLLIPPQTTILASFGLFSTMRILNTWMPIVLPCLFGLGLRGALFVLIYMYFFQRIPDVMDDAARIDGAGAPRVFFQIMLPLVKSAIVIVFIFSFVWHWNDNTEAVTYLFNKEAMTLQPKLANIRNYYSDLIGSTDMGASSFEKAMTEPMLFAGCLLVMLPVLLVYIFGQKHLAAGIERIGVIE